MAFRYYFADCEDVDRHCGVLRHSLAASPRHHYSRSSGQNDLWQAVRAYLLDGFTMAYSYNMLRQLHCILLQEHKLSQFCQQHVEEGDL